MYANQEVYVVFQEIMKETMATMVSAASFSCLELDHFNADFVVNSFPCKSLLQFREISSGLELDVVHMAHPANRAGARTRRKDEDRCTAHLALRHSTVTE